MAAIDSKYHLKIGDMGFILSSSDRKNQPVYQREEAPAFVNKFSSGDPNYRDASFFPHFVQTDWLNGFDQEFFDDPGKFYRSDAIDTTDRTKLQLEQAFNSAGQVASGINILTLAQLPGNYSWFNTNYTYRRRLTITAPGSSQNMPIGYPIKTTVDTDALVTATKLQADRDDWRVVYFNGTSWVDLTRHYVSSAVTIFALQAAISAGAEDSNYYVYYGYSSETTNKQPATNAEWNAVYVPDNATNTKLLVHTKETSGTTIADTSGNSHDVTLNSGGAIATDGKFANCMSFDGTNDYGSITDHTDLKPTGNFTIEMYIKTSSSAATLFQSKRNDGLPSGFEVQLQSGKVVYHHGTGAAWSTDVVGATSVNDGSWHHVACTWDGTNIKIYIDSVLDKTTAYAVAPAYGGTNYVRVGARSDTGTETNFLNGKITGLRLINGTALTSFSYAIVEDNPTVSDGGEVSQSQAGTTGGAKIFAGASDSKIYEWDGATTWTERFNTRRMTQYDDIATIDTEVYVGDTGGTERAQAQSFQLAAASKVKAIDIYIKKNQGTPSDLQVRIETNNAGVPSGTLAHANLAKTVAVASISSSFGWVTVEFDASADLAASTTYHLVLKTAAASNDNNYLWKSDGSSPTYASGQGSLSNDGGSVWSAVSAEDRMFRILSENAPVNCSVLASFSGTTYLYFGVGDPNTSNDTTARIYRTSDGTSYTLVKTFTNAVDGGTNSAVLSLGFYNSSVFAGLGPTARIYSSSDGSAFTISQDINEPNLPGYPYAMVVYNKSLYVAGGSPEKFRGSNTQGFLYRFDGFEWNLVYPFDFTTLKSLAVYDSLLFIGTASKRLYVYNTATVDKLFEFPWPVSINAMATYNDKLAIALGPTDASSPTGFESIYLFDRNGLHDAFSNTADGYNCVLSINNMLLAGTSSNGYTYKTVTDNYVASGTLQTSYFEAQLPSIDKLFRDLTLQYDALPQGCSILAEYRTDESGSWTSLGTANTVSSTSATFTFGVAIYAKKISLRVTLATSNVSATPTLRKIIMKYVLYPDFKYIWRLTLLCVDEMQWLDGTRPVGKLNAAVSAAAATITLTDTSGFPDPNGSTGYARVVDSSGNEDVFSYTGKTSTTLTGIPSSGTYALSAHAAVEVGVSVVKVKAADIHKAILDLKQTKKFYTLTDVDGNTYTVLFNIYQTQSWSINQLASNQLTNTGIENEVPVTLLEA